MTGRRLYDHWCDAHAATCTAWRVGEGDVPSGDLRAWPFLDAADRRTWNRLAAAISPRARKR